MVFTSWESWDLIARTAALIRGMYVVICDRAGVEDGITFSGGSMVVDPSGMDIAWERDSVARARHSFSHLRDDDAAVTLRTLERILGER